MRALFAALVWLVCASGAWAQPALDAVAFSVGAVPTGSSYTITTTHANEIIQVDVACGFGAASSVTISSSPSLTFNAVWEPQGAGTCGGAPTQLIYYAVAATAQAYTLTISTPSGGYGSGTARSIYNVNTGAPFDPSVHGYLFNAPNAGSCSGNCQTLLGVYTQNSNDLALCGTVMNATVTPTNFGTMTTDHVDYKQFYGHIVYASPQSNITIQAVNEGDGNFLACVMYTATVTSRSRIIQ